MKNACFVLAVAVLCFAAPAKAELRLLVDVDGTTYFQNIGAQPLRFDAYAIRSPSGRLDPFGWISFQDSFVNDPLEAIRNLQVHGLEPTGRTRFRLSESSNGAGAVMQPGARWSIGHPFEQDEVPPDLQFEFSNSGNTGGSPFQMDGGIVRIREPSDPNMAGVDLTRLGRLLAGDTNNDLRVDLQDFTVLKEVFGTSAPQPDFDEDGIVGLNDFNILKENFGVSLVAVVPEPSSLMLLVCGVCVGLAARCRRALMACSFRRVYSKSSGPSERKSPNRRPTFPASRSSSSVPIASFRQPRVRGEGNTSSPPESRRCHAT